MLQASVLAHSSFHLGFAWLALTTAYCSLLVPRCSIQTGGVFKNLLLPQKIVEMNDMTYDVYDERVSFSTSGSRFSYFHVGLDNKKCLLEVTKYKMVCT